MYEDRIRDEKKYASEKMTIYNLIYFYINKEKIEKEIEKRRLA